MKRRSGSSRVSARARSQKERASVFRPSLTLRPSPPFEMEIFGNASWSYGDPRWMFTAPLADGSRAYFFGQLDARSVDLSVRALYAFTNRFTVIAQWLTPYLPVY